MFGGRRLFKTFTLGHKTRRYMANENVISDMKTRMNDILMSVSWREISRNYFGKSSSWFYHKMDGIDGNGGVGGFNEEEAATMKQALLDLSNRIALAAEKI